MCPKSEEISATKFALGKVIKVNLQSDTSRTSILLLLCAKIEINDLGAKNIDENHLFTDKGREITESLANMSSAEVAQIIAKIANCCNYFTENLLTFLVNLD